MRKLLITYIALFIVLLLSIMLFLTLDSTAPYAQRLNPIDKLEQVDVKKLYNNRSNIKLLFAGDTMLDRSIRTQILEGKNPFKYVESVFKKYDLVLLNLETSLGDIGTPQKGKLYTFQAPIKAITYLKESGVDIVGLANNHTMDYGDDAFQQMINLLDKSNIKYFGAGIDEKSAFSPLKIRVGQVSMRFYGYNDIETYFNAATKNTPGSAWFDIEKIKSSMSMSENKVDITIPFVHWGHEYSANENARQVRLGKMLIDNGASIVIGGHPHVIQPTTTYNNKEVIYSLGNFVFDKMYQDAAKGNMVEISIKDKKIDSIKLIPIQINKDGFPELVN